MRVLTLCILLGALLLAPLSIDAQSQKPKPKAKPKSVKSLQSNLGSVRKKQATVRKEIRETRAEAKEVKKDITEVDARLGNLEDDLAKTSTQLRSSQARQMTLAEELKKTTVELGLAKDQVERRLRAMYMRGESMVLTAFVKARDVGEIASNKYLMEQIANEDRRIFSNYQYLQRQLAQKKQRQDEVVQQVRSLKARQQQQQNSLASVRQEKAVALNQLRGKEQELLAVLRQFERDEAAIEGQIRAYLASLRRPGAVNLPPFRGGFGRPVSGRLSSGYGMRFHPILRRTKLHTGVDFAAPSGTPIRAAASGVVIGASYLRGYGNTVILDHGSGMSTVYAHCSRIYVRPGTKVAKGQTIAAVGSTGYSTGPHLHFEIRVNGRPVNPLGRF